MQTRNSFRISGKIFMILPLIYFVFFFSSAAISLEINESKPTVVAPSNLAPREQSSLQRQYTHEVRQKNLLLSPYAGEERDGDGSAFTTTEDQSEYERLHRYFGIALVLHKEGRIEEAAEILQYISDRDPDDRYVREQLSRVRKEIDLKKRRFEAENAIEASHLKKNKVDNLVNDGILYYDTKDFDRALLRFADALALDPANTTANRYMNELKKRYSKEIEVENIVQDWTTGKSNYKKSDDVLSEAYEKEAADKLRQTAEKLLDNEKGKYGILDEKADTLLSRIEKDARAKVKQAADRLLDEKKMEYLLLDKRASSLLNRAELENRIKEIISVKGIEDKKAEQFTLGSGDIIQISVRDHPELSGKATVQLKGEVVLPLVNDTVMARGLNTNELAEKVTDVLRRYVQEPYVNIAVIEYKSKLFYVIDEDSCTPYPITRAYLSLRDALFISDWGNNRALGRVLVIKPSKRNPVIKKVDAFDLIFRGNLENNVRIDDGDVIYVPMTIVAKVTKTLFDVTAPFRAIRTARDEYLNLKWNAHDWKGAFRVPPNYGDLTDYGGEAEDAKDLARFGSLRDLFIK